MLPAVFGEVHARRDGTVVLIAVAPIGDAVAGVELDALEVVDHLEVDDARNGRPSVHGRGAARDDLDVLDEAAGIRFTSTVPSRWRERRGRRHQHQDAVAAEPRRSMFDWPPFDGLFDVLVIAGTNCGSE